MIDNGADLQWSVPVIYGRKMSKYWTAIFISKSSQRPWLGYWISMISTEDRIISAKHLSQSQWLFNSTWARKLLPGRVSAWFNLRLGDFTRWITVEPHILCTLRIILLQFVSTVCMSCWEQAIFPVRSVLHTERKHTCSGCLLIFWHG